MGQMTCSECGCEIPNRDWSCPACGNPAEESAGARGGIDISTKGMIALLLLFVFIPVLLFLIHIFVPNM